MELDLTDSRLRGNLLINILKMSHVSLKSLVLANTDITTYNNWTITTRMWERIEELAPIVNEVTAAILGCQGFETLTFRGVGTHDLDYVGLVSFVYRLLYSLDDFPGPMLNLR